MPAHAKSWAIGAVFLMMFCWLGFAAFKFAPIYNGLEDRLPMTTRLTVTYGPVAFPLFGVVTAVSLVLADVFCQRRWVQWIVIAAAVVLIVCIFQSLLFSGVFMVPAHRTARLAERTGSFMIADAVRVLCGK